MKILDRYILTTYLKTFISVFVILMLIFVLQTIWLYIKELAGKDLDIFVIAKFLIYFTPKLIPLVLPLTILLASIMVFGNFAENYEFAAMKSTGISLQRAMASLSVFIVILGVVTFFFSNNVIPWAEFNSFNLRKNIAKLKPAMAIAEGQFNEVGNINIKVAEKSGDRGQYLKDVVIHKKSPKGVGNYTTIISKTGELIGEEKSDIIQLILFDGNYYDDTPPKNYKDRNKKPFVKSEFEKYTFNIDLSNLNDVDLDEKGYSDKYDMLNMSDLSYTIDSLKIKRKEDYQDFSSSLYNRAGLSNLNKGLNINDIERNKKGQDTISKEHFLNYYNHSRKVQLISMALNSVKSTKQIMSVKEINLKTRNIWLNKHIIALHEKLALGFACIILFFVGAPLGALIRKGGIGLPMVIAILLFLTYHFIGIFAKNSAKDGSFSPVFATWFSTLIMLPLSIFLTKRATADKGLFEFDNFIEPLKAMFNFKSKNFESENVSSKHKLHEFNDEKLIDIAKNYKKYNYSNTDFLDTINVLNSRNISYKALRNEGIIIPESIDESEKILDDFKSHSKYALSHYIISVALFILFFVFRNNKLPSLAEASIQLSLMALVIFMVYYFISFKNLRQFYRCINRLKNKPNVMLLILGLPFYFIPFMLLKYKLKQDLRQNSLDSLK
ncbi:LptF/LptG family permease [Yeosuana sp. MJ-SS3]|uniref:LptF/LptG family permease n=2 Tax=Gilvirhabdus luticola TaxID=3079858 RepID=A0ABU3U7A7_9FLAO|nr:LptF/LptG family permease [Yeosuana sp. MJ-SS3]MDU8886298.1 LptF/LptG family permease [Yeosuana sp. MJ-SS3]